MKELHITKTGGGFLPCASIIEKGSDAAAWAFYQPVEPSGAASRLLAGLIALIRVEPGRNELAPETASAAEQGTAAHQRGNGAATLRVLIAEDDPSARTGLMELVRAWGYDTTGAVDGDDALAKVDSEQPDIVLADLVMPRRDGLSLLRALGDRLNELTFVMITAQGSVDSAVTAVKEGAYDYLTKPIDPQRLRVLLEKTVERHDTLRQVAALKRQLLKSGRFGRTIGSSPAIREVYQLIEQTAPAEASVLVWGESGTGKELVARTIHELSPRVAAPFVALNCAAIPEGLLESEIFGHERGAFTGAVDRRHGCFELAHKGTLFLDEVAEMAPVLQVKLLRVLQERTIRRLGGSREQPVDVRIIAATNANPQDAIRDHRLRDDLYYRINVVTIPMPPLRDRRDDIPLLVQAFLAEFNERNRRNVRGVSPAAMELACHPMCWSESSSSTTRRSPMAAGLGCLWSIESYSCTEARSKWSRRLMLARGFASRCHAPGSIVTGPDWRRR